MPILQRPEGTESTHRPSEVLQEPLPMSPRKADRLMDQPQLSWLVNFVWGIADDILRDI